MIRDVPCFPRNQMFQVLSSTVAVGAHTVRHGNRISAILCFTDGSVSGHEPRPRTGVSVVCVPSVEESEHFLIEAPREFRSCTCSHHLCVDDDEV